MWHQSGEDGFPTPVVFIDAIHVKIRDGKVVNRPVYTVVGVTVAGERDILGLWVGDGGEVRSTGIEREISEIVNDAIKVDEEIERAAQKAPDPPRTPAASTSRFVHHDVTEVSRTIDSCPARC